MLLFWRKGYAATSVEDLVGALHLSRSSFYATFGDKRSLFLAALKLYSERVISRTARTLSEAPSPLAGFQTLFDELSAGAGSEAGARGCFMVNSVAELVPYDADVAAIALAYSDALQRLFAEALTRAAGGGTITRKEKPEQLAAYLFNAMQGIRILIKAGASRERVQSVSNISLHGLL